MALVVSGQSRRAVSRLFGIGEATIIRWMRRGADTGQCAVQPMGAHRPEGLRFEQVWLHARPQAVEFTTRGVRAELAARGNRVSHDAVWRVVRRARLTFKKSLRTAEQDRPDGAGRRARWMRHQHRIDPARLMFVDEIWAKTNMTRSRDWALRGNT